MELCQVSFLLELARFRSQLCKRVLTIFLGAQVYGQEWLLLTLWVNPSSLSRVTELLFLAHQVHPLICYKTSWIVMPSFLHSLGVRVCQTVVLQSSTIEFIMMPVRMALHSAFLTSALQRETISQQCQLQLESSINLKFSLEMPWATHLWVMQ